MNLSTSPLSFDDHRLPEDEERTFSPMVEELASSLEEEEPIRWKRVNEIKALLARGEYRVDSETLARTLIRKLPF
jgi:flagellar biosynthesis anti-sigma factor FlgM